MRFLLDVVYALALIAASPVWLYRMLRHGRYRSDIAQYFGGVPMRYGLQPVVWIHGVSVGEVNAARTLVQEINAQLPDLRVVVSSTTDTGTAAARKRYGKDHLVFRFPKDFSFAVRRAIRRIRPSLIVLIEGDMWPNFLAACNREDIPVVVVNGRMSPDKGYPGYRRLGGLAPRLLFNRLAAIGVQTETYADCFRRLGTDPDRVHVTGMLKFDTVDTTDRLPGKDELAAALNVTDEQTLIVAGGTGPGEEAQLLGIWPGLKERHPSARLAIVPRKPERFDEVAAEIEKAGLPLARRTQYPDGAAESPSSDSVILGDTMGELRTFYAIARLVFVGRSLVEMGGSDMIEAAAMGKPTAFGPHTYNFPQADALAEHGCVRVADIDELRRQLDAWLSDPHSAAASGAQAGAYVASRQGATKRNVEMICGVLGREPAVADGAIATDRIEANA